MGDTDIEAANEDGEHKERHSMHLKFLKHEHMKPQLYDFTLDEYTEKIIQYGFLMVSSNSQEGRVCVCVCVCVCACMHACVRVCVR